MAEFKIFENWIKPAEFMTEEQKKEYYGIICVHMTGTPQKPDNAKDPTVRAVLVNVLPLADQSSKKIEEDVERGKRGGRPSKLTKEMVHDFVLEHPNYTCQQVADHFGVSHTTIAHNQGWKDRDKFWF